MPIDTFDLDIAEIDKHISELDDMYQGNIEHYISVGNSALQCIYRAMHNAGKEVSDITNILDFPCGYGRVMRVMNVAFPGAKITGCDLVQEGVDFCSNKFGSRQVYSDKNIKNVNLNDTYDLIWVGSLFTHLDEEQWDAFLDFFKKALKPGGMLLFTTHGRYPATMLKTGGTTYGLESDEKINSLLSSYENTGFGFSSYFHSDDYGISLSKPSYVINKIEAMDDLKIILCIETGWDSHQDVYGCLKVY